MMKKTLMEGLPGLGLALDEKTCDTLCAFGTAVVEQNKVMNLTAITQPDQVAKLHLLDSISLLTLENLDGKKMIDVGCGAGFPTLPLAIFRPDITVIGLDGTAKRIEYVKSTAKKLGLLNVTAIAGRAEDYANMPEYRERFDIATARAVAALPILSEICLPFVKIGGKFISMKASQGENEAELAQNAITVCGGAISNISLLNLTADGENFEKRVIIEANKSKSTPSKYPRHYSQISKKPL